MDKLSMKELNEEVVRLRQQVATLESETKEMREFIEKWKNSDIYKEHFGKK